jgi:PAS domain S-box-containing protein
MEEEIDKLKNIIIFKDSEIKRLKEEISTLKNIISYFPGIIVILNRYGVIEYINENGAKILGYSSIDELVGEDWFERCVPEYMRENLKFIFEQIIEGNREELGLYEGGVETKYKRVKIFTWRNFYLKDEKGNIIKTLSYGMEIIQKDLIKETEERLIRIFDFLPEAIHIIDRDYKIIYCNNTFKKWNKILGLETEIINKKVFDVFPFLSEKIREEYETVFIRGEILITKEKNLIKDMEIETETRKIPIFEKDKVIHVITLIREITNFLSD